MSKTDQSGEIGDKLVRQTFIIGANYLDRIKDLVYTRRRSGQFEYAQKDAIHEALDLLFKKASITKRPEEIREKERKRSSSIKEAKK